MSTVFKVIYNSVRLIIKKTFCGCTYSGSLLHTISYRTQLCFASGSKISFGRNVQSDGSCRLIAGHKAELSIGRGTYFNQGCTIAALESIQIGEKCVFGPNVAVFDNNHDFDNEGVKFSNNTAAITIGNRCWLASNVIVLKGVKIGDNCVIGAGCIIKEDIPSGSIVTCKQDLHVHSIGKREEKENE